MTRKRETVTPEEEINPRALKYRFGSELLHRIAAAIGAVDPSFDQQSFVGLAPQLETLEMKSRVRCIRDVLRSQLPEDYPKALEILLLSIRDDKLQGFDLWPYTEFVQTYGLDYPDVSLEALRELTKVFTSEWAVRPFIIRHTKRTMSFLLSCTEDNDVNVRRWASEGSRPRLPWGERLQLFVQDPHPTLPILERLKFDRELFVRKSVANHLNDIAKDHPEFVIETLRRWKSGASEDDLAIIDWITRRSLRTLIKGGHREALELIGVVEAEIAVDQFKLAQKTIKIGEQLDFEFTVRSTSNNDQKLVIDYLVHFVRANGTTAAKVFKLKTVQFPAMGITKITKSHQMKKITTREYYAGQHSLEIQINGTIYGKQSWTLEL